MRRNARDWLEECLADGPKEVSVIRDAAKEQGIPWVEIKSAKAALNIQVKSNWSRDHPVSDCWFWSLPEEVYDMTEKDLERRLVRRVEALGGRAYKFVSPGNAGVPDRLVCLPGGLAVFVELKRPGESPRPLQQSQIERLRRLGFTVGVVSDLSGLEAFFRACIDLGAGRL